MLSQAQLFAILLHLDVAQDCLTPVQAHEWMHHVLVPQSTATLTHPVAWQSLVYDC